MRLHVFKVHHVCLKSQDDPRELELSNHVDTDLSNILNTWYMLSNAMSEVKIGWEWEEKNFYCTSVEMDGKV